YIEILQVSCIIGDGVRLIRTGAVAKAAAKRVLRVQCQTFARPALQRDLQGVITVMAAAGFVINLTERMGNIRAAVIDVEFADNDRGLGWIDLAKGDYSVGNASDEKISSLTSDVCHRRKKFARKFPLHRKIVLIDSLGDLVVRRISAGRERTI